MENINDPTSTNFILYIYIYIYTHLHTQNWLSKIDTFHYIDNKDLKLFFDKIYFSKNEQLKNKKNKICVRYTRKFLQELKMYENTD